MIRSLQANDTTWIDNELKAINSSLIVDKSFDQSNIVALFKDDDPKIFCSIKYYEIPTGYYSFSGMASQVSFLIGTIGKVEDVMPILSKTLYEMGQKQPDALGKPVFATLDENLTLQFKPFFKANVNKRLIWLPTLQEAINRSVRYR